MILLLYSMYSSSGRAPTERLSGVRNVIITGVGGRTDDGRDNKLKRLIREVKAGCQLRRRSRGRHSVVNRRARYLAVRRTPPCETPSTAFTLRRARVVTERR